MGELVQLDAQRRQGKTKRTELPARGQIVIFTGVRYERAETPPAAPRGQAAGGPTPAKPRRRRG